MLVAEGGRGGAGGNIPNVLFLKSNRNSDDGGGGGGWSIQNVYILNDKTYLKGGWDGRGRVRVNIFQIY